MEPHPPTSSSTASLLQHNTPKSTSTAESSTTDNKKHHSTTAPLPNVSIDEALFETTSLPYTCLLILLCGSGYFFDGIELALIPFILPILQKEWNLNFLETGLLGSSVFAGMIVGAFGGGILADRVGRKFIFCCATLVTTLMGITSGFSPGFLSFVVLRLTVGIGLGSSLPIDYTVLMEFVHKNQRGPILSIMNIFSGVGGTVEAVIAWWILTDHPEQWRLLVFVSAFPGVIIVLLRFFMVPESPRWLIMRGRQDDAFQVLRKIAFVSKKKFPEEWVTSNDQRAIHLTGSSAKESVQQGAGTQFLSIPQQLQHIFGRKLITTTTILLPVWFLLSFGAWGFNLLTPTLLIRVHATNPYSAILFMSVLSGTSFIFTILFVDKVPRKAFLFFGFLMCGIVLCLLGLWDNIYYVIIVGGVTNFFTTFPWSVLYLYSSEVFPTSVRSTGVGLCSTLTRLGGILTPIVGEYLLGYGTAYPFLLYGLALIVAGLLSALLPLETLKRELEDTVFEPSINPEDLQGSTFATSTATQEQVDEAESEAMSSYRRF